MDNKDLFYTRESWSGDSRDGVIINGEGYHLFKMDSTGFIFEAYESYESEDGEQIVTPLPEMENISWIDDLGFSNFELLEKIRQDDFISVSSIALKKKIIS